MPGGSPAARPAPGLPSSSPVDVGGGHPAVRALADLGLLDPVASALVRVEDLSRAHPVWSVVLPDGRRLVVKSSAPERGLDLGVEFLVYRLAVWCQPVRDALPEALVVDEDRHLLVLANARGSAPEASGPLGTPAPGPTSAARPAGSLAEQAGWPDLVHPGARRGLSTHALAEACHALGRTLGALHRGTTGLPLPPRPPAGRPRRPDRRVPRLRGGRRARRVVARRPRPHRCGRD